MRWLSTAVSSWVLILLAGSSAAAGETSPPESPPPEITLTPDAPVDLPWGSDTDRVVVRVDLGGPGAAIIQIEQRGLDVVVRAPGGDCDPDAWTTDLRRSPRGTEYAPIAILEPGGPTKLEVEAKARPKADASLKLSVGEIRPEDEGVSYCRGWRSFLEARTAADDGLAGQESAIRAYRTSAEWFRRIEDTASLGQVLLNQAVSEHWMGRTPAALDHLSEVRRLLAATESSRSTLIDATIEAAIIYQRLGRNELAAALFTDAIELAELIDDRQRLAKSTNGLGLSLKSSDRWNQALEAYERARELARGGHRCRESAVLTNLGGIHARLGRYQTAMDRLVEAANLAEPEDGGSACRHLSATLNSLASLYARLGRFEIASARFEEALRYVDALGRVRLLQNYGWNLFRLGEIAQARDVFQQAVVLARDKQDDKAEFAVRCNLAHIYSTKLGQIDEARRQLDLAAALIVPSVPSDENVALSIHRAALSERTGQLDLADAQASKALEMARSLGSRTREMSALQMLARVRLASGATRSAVSAAEDSVKIVESLQSQAAIYDLQSSFLSNWTQLFELWIRALLQLHREEPDGGHALEALAVAERAHARVLLEMLSHAAVERSDQVDTELARLERKLETLSLRHEELAESPSGDELRQVELDLTETQAGIFERQAVLRSTRPDWAELKVPEPLNGREIQAEATSRDTVLIHSFVGPDQGWIWLVTPNEIKVRQIPGEEELGATVRRLLSLLTSRSTSVPGETLAGRRLRIASADQEFETASRDAMEQLLGPLLRGLDADRVFVVADGPLAYLPLGALPIPDSEPWSPLILKHEWIHLPSVSVLRSIRRKSASRSGSVDSDLAIVADPVFSIADPRLRPADESEIATSRSEIHRQFQRLPETGEEARVLADLAKGSLVAVGLEATTDLVKSGRLENYRIVHFATHGVLDTRYPDLSALVLSQVDSSGNPIDGFLRLADIYRLDLNAQLVVLSACETALGQRFRGEGLVGLTRGFMYAGASSVVASLWTVQDRTTRQLMETFYRGLLQDGMQASSALHAAQRSMATTLAPYHWAGFVLQGEGNVSVRRNGLTDRDTTE